MGGVCLRWLQADDASACIEINAAHSPDLTGVAGGTTKPLCIGRSRATPDRSFVRVS
jgi:hypothetical protein